MELITESNFEFQFDVDNDKFLGLNFLSTPTELINNYDNTTSKATKTKSKINRKRKKASQPKTYDNKSKQYQQLQLLQFQIGAFPNAKSVIDPNPTLVPGCVLPSWEDLEFDEFTNYIQSQSIPSPTTPPTPTTPSPKKLKTSSSSETKVKLKCQAKTQWGAPCTHFAKVGTRACGLLEHKAQLGEK